MNFEKQLGELIDAAIEDGYSRAAIAKTLEAHSLAVLAADEERDEDEDGEDEEAG